MKLYEVKITLYAEVPEAAGDAEIEQITDRIALIAEPLIETLRAEIVERVPVAWGPRTEEG